MHSLRISQMARLAGVSAHSLNRVLEREVPHAKSKQLSMTIEDFIDWSQSRPSLYLHILSKAEHEGFYVPGHIMGNNGLHFHPKTDVIHTRQSFMNIDRSRAKELGELFDQTLTFNLGVRKRYALGRDLVQECIDTRTAIPDQLARCCVNGHDWVMQQVGPLRVYEYKSLFVTKIPGGIYFFDSGHRGLLQVQYEQKQYQLVTGECATSLWMTNLTPQQHSRLVERYQSIMCESHVV